MKVSLLIAILTPLAAVIGGILTFLGLRRQTNATTEQDDDANIRADLAAARAEIVRWQTRADQVQERLDAERTMWEQQRAGLLTAAREMEYRTILLERALERAHIEVPRGASSKTGAKA